MLENVHKHFFFPLLHAAGDLRDIMGVVFNSTAQADRVDPDDISADDPSAMLVSVSGCLLNPECVMFWCIVAWLSESHLLARRHAVGACKSGSVSFYTHPNRVSTCVPSCQISDGSTHGGSKATEPQMIQALAWNALGKAAAPTSYNIVRHQRNRQDYAKHPAAGTNQHAAALVVDISVVNFWLDPRYLLVEDEMWNCGILDFDNNAWSLSILLLGLARCSRRVSRQVVKRLELSRSSNGIIQVHGCRNGIAGRGVW